MAEPEGHPPGTKPEAQMETTIDPHTNQVTSKQVDEQTRQVEVQNRSPFSKEVEEKFGDLLGRFKSADGEYNLDAIAQSLAEKQKMISAGEHKKAPEGEPNAGPAKEEVSTGDNPPEPTSKAPKSDAPIKTTSEDPTPEAPTSEDSLSFEQLDALMAENGGLTQEQIDRYKGDWEIAQEALTARAEKRQNGLAAKEALMHELTGGAAAYLELLNWAGANLSQEDADRFNNAFKGNDMRLLELEAKDLIAKRTQIDGNYGQHFAGAGSSGPTGDVFNSAAEYNAFIDANKYSMQNNREFAAKVQAKMARSIRAGKISV